MMCGVGTGNEVGTGAGNAGPVSWLTATFDADGSGG